MVAGDAQTLTISAANSTGTITTANVSLAGATTKTQAITAINAQLSAAGGPLAGVFAVDDGSATGHIELLGTGQNSAHQVSVGADANTPGDSVGAQGTTIASTGSGGSSLDISTAAGAQSAVSVLANAVTSLGTAQAAAGKGENNFNYYQPGEFPVDQRNRC